MRCKMCGVFILREHTCSSVVLIVKIVMSNFECVKYSSLLNTLKGICFDDEQYVYCTKSRGTKARSWSWSWSCHSGLDLGLGFVSFGLGLKNLVLFTSLIDIDVFVGYHCIDMLASKSRARKIDHVGPVTGYSTTLNDKCGKFHDKVPQLS